MVMVVMILIDCGNSDGADATMHQVCACAQALPASVNLPHPTQQLLYSITQQFPTTRTRCLATTQYHANGQTAPPTLLALLQLHGIEWGKAQRQAARQVGKALIHLARCVIALGVRLLDQLGWACGRVYTAAWCRDLG